MLPAFTNVANFSDYNLEERGEYESLVVVREDGAERRYSNRELHDGARSLASALVERGVKAGDRVVVSLPNCAELLMSYQAVLACGATVVPLLVGHTPRELADRVEHCEAAALIGSDRFLVADEVRAVASLRLLISVSAQPPGNATSIAELLVGHAPLQRPVAVDLDDLACILYTGGTTGESRGVMRTHRNLYANIRNNAPLNETSIDLVVLPLTHSFGLGLWLSSYVAGSKTVLLDQFDPELTLRKISEHAVERMAAVPTMLMALLEHPAADRYDTATMRQWGSGGAPMEDAVMRRFLERFSGHIIRTYGLTEAGPTVSRVRPGEPLSRGSSGRVLDGVEVMVSSPEGKALAAGRVGEICVRGDSVSPGYYKMPKQTAETFRDGWLHTGDLGRLDEDGTLHIVGRAKDMILQGGFNVYPSEIEGVLAKHPGLHQAAVIGVPDDLVGEAVVAYVSPSMSYQGDVDETTIKAHCAEHLAAYKVPVRVYVLAELPRTQVGKVDKKALIERSRLQASRAAESPMSLPRELRRQSVQERLADMFARVLGCDKVEPSDNFFELGGRSLHVTQLIAWLRDSMGAKVELRVFFEAPTAEALAGRVVGSLEEVVAEATDEERVVVPTSEAIAQTLRERFGAERVERLLPLTVAQEDALGKRLDERRVLTAEALRESGMRMEVDIIGTKFEPELLRQTWFEMVRRHEALRAVLVWEDLPEPQQVILDDVKPLWSYVDLRHLESKQQDQALDEMLSECMPHEPPWVQLRVVQLKDDYCKLVIHYHMPAVDGLTLSVLRQELMIGYASLSSGSGLDLPTRRPFVDYIEWLQAQPVAPAKAFWTEVAKKFVGWTSVRGSHDGGDVRSTIQLSGVRMIEQTAREMGLPVSGLLIGAWALAYKLFDPRERHVIGMMDTGRNAGLSGIDSTIGSFSHRLPLVIEFPEDMPLVEWLRKIQLDVADLQTYEYALSRRRMADWWKLPGDCVPFTTGINIQYMRMVEHELASRLPMEMDPTKAGSAGFWNAPGWCVVPVNCSMWFWEGEEVALGFGYTYDHDRYTHEQILELAGGHFAAVEHVINYPDDPVGEALADLAEPHDDDDDA